MLMEMEEWGSLLGCSIKPLPNADKKAVEAESEKGLRLQHAYGLIKAAEVELDDKKTVKLLRIRNPW